MSISPSWSVSRAWCRFIPPLTLVLRQGLVWAITGIVMGLLAANLLARTLKSFVFGIGTSDPATLAGVSAVLIAAATLACYFPIRKAAKIDPMVALRYE